MIQVQVRRQGGAAIMTIPADVLKLINVEVGSVMELDVVDGALVARPSPHGSSRHYTVKELLHGVTPEMLEALSQETEWFRSGESVGRELP